MDARDGLAELQQLLLNWFRQHALPLPHAQSPLAVAYSGGVDSTVLLHSAQSLWPNAVVAIHVNHGLQAAAPAFEAHCTVQCQQLGVPLRVMRANICLQPGDSLEEQARCARRALLRQAARECQAGVVWLAQHADDQAETVLLALSRGSGLTGLAGMGQLTTQDGLSFGRPFLAVPQARLRQAAQAHGWPFIDDPTNLDKRHTRNRIRLDVMPVLSQTFPHVVSTLARTAGHCADAETLLVELARMDLQATGVPPALSGLQALTATRQANALRCWLRDVTGRAPSTAQLNELIRQVAAATTRGHRIDIKVGDGRVVRQGHHLSVHFSPSAMGSGAASHSQD